MKKFLFLLCTTIILTSCVKLRNPSGNDSSEFKIPSNFDWKTFEPMKVSFNGKFSVVNQDGDTIAKNLPAGDYNLYVGKGSLLTIVPSLSIETKSISKPVDGTESRIYFPAEDKYATVMFEDLFPVPGDRDMNDLVFGLNIEYDLNAGAEVLAINFNIEPRAAGAIKSYLGLAASFTGYPVKVADITRHSSTYPEITKDHSDLAPIYKVIEPREESYGPANPSDPQADYRVAPFTGNFRKFFINPSSSYINVSNVDPTTETHNFSVQVTLDQIIHYKKFSFFEGNDPDKVNIDIFATIEDRSTEVHFKGQPPTNYFNYDLFKIANEDFTSDDKWVWAIMSDKSVRHALERVKIYDAYPGFEKWFETQDMSVWYYSYDKELVFTKKDFNYFN
ncbi:MAG: LruC domain-containing protein [Rikenellaceae bacterium]